jgi:hypothetical protein
MFYRVEGWVQTPLGAAIAGASVAVLTQPASFATQPGSPLANVYAASSSNAATITAASWNAQELELTFSTAPPADVVPNSYISLAAVNPATFDSTLEAPYLVISVVGNVVTVAAITNPGTYVSGGTVGTSVLPNPLTTDGNGYYFGYTSAGLVSLQVYYATIELDFPDQPVGTVAGGSVTSVAISVPSYMTVSGSPVVAAGTIALGFGNENSNVFFAGPSSGPAAAPTFRAIAAGDLPAGVGSVTSVAVAISSLPSIFTSSISGSPITSNGTIGITIGLAVENANLVWAGPTTGAAAQPTFRSLVFADVLAAYPVQTASGATDALAFPGSTFITTAGVDATTLATPANPGDNGKVLRVTDTTGHAHTVTASAGIFPPSHHLITFNGTVGSYVELEAFNGLWYVGAASGVTVS